MLGLTSAVGRTSLLAGIPLIGAISYAGLTRIEWVLTHQDEIGDDAARINLDESKLNQT